MKRAKITGEITPFAAIGLHQVINYAAGWILISSISGSENRVLGKIIAGRVIRCYTLERIA